MEYLKIVRNLLDELNENITYCHWKSNQHFSNALIGIDDLDILVDRTQKNELIKILSKLNFKHFYTPVPRTYVGIEDYLGFDEETGKIIHLHLHYQLVVGEKHLKGFHLPFEKIVLNNRRYNETYNAYLSSYSDELLLLILRLGMKNRKRDFFKKKRFDRSTYQEYVWLKDNCTDFANILSQYDFLTERIKELVIDIYNCKYSWSNMNKLKKYLYKDFAAYSLGNCSYNTILRHSHEFSRIVYELKKRYTDSNNTFLRRRSASGGVLISFLGSDGSGKSSSIKEINEWLKKVMDVRIFYLGSGDGKSSLLRLPLILIKKVLQKKKIINKTNNITNKNLEINEKKIGFVQKMWIYTLSKERIKKLKQAFRCKTRGYVVLTDRYPQDEFPGLCDGRRLYNFNGIAARKERECYRIARMCPPDVAIKLIVSPEEAIKRKPDEIDYEISKNLTERIKKITFNNNTKCVEVNSDKTQQDVILEIKKIIWNSL